MLHFDITTVRARHIAPPTTKKTAVYYIKISKINSDIYRATLPRLSAAISHRALSRHAMRRRSSDNRMYVQQQQQQLKMRQRRTKLLFIFNVWFVSICKYLF